MSARATNGNGPIVTLLLDDAPRQAIEAHAERHRTREVAGFLVGRLERQAGGHYDVTINGYLEARFTLLRAGSVTLSPDSWHFAHAELARRYPGRPSRLVGWTHTHPGRGAVLSEPDRFIHRAFFRLPWQVAAVVDPLVQTASFFGWSVGQGDVQQLPFVWQWG